MSIIVTLPLANETDVVRARQRVRQAAEIFGFDEIERTRFATAVSEVARNAVQYAGGGRVEIGVRENGRVILVVTVSDNGTGLPDDVALGRRGSGLMAARKLVDNLDVAKADNGGARITLARASAKLLKLTPEISRTAAKTLAVGDVSNPYEELVRQNSELARTLDLLRAREDELARTNRELADTNSGVLALYAELEEKAEALRRAADSKERFYSEMNHELRTPLNAILSLSEILLNGSTGKPSDAQEKPLGFLRKSALQMSELVDDLLDLARVEAGKMTVRVTEFTVADMVGSLRGVFRPLHNNEQVRLAFDSGADAGTMRSDEGKIAQVLRNLVSNAIKFTDSGEVRLGVTSTSEAVTFTVSDTGIGISPQDQQRLFEAFTRVEPTNRRAVKGTGLGLTVSKRLAELIGGHLDLTSEAGKGSRFSLIVPRVITAEADATGPILIIDDDEISRYLLKELLARPASAIREAVSGEQGVRMAQHERPAVVFLDLNMPGMDGFEVLDLLKRDEATRDIPVIVNTSQVLSAEEHERLSAQALAVCSKDGAQRQIAKAAIEHALRSIGMPLEPHYD